MSGVQDGAGAPGRRPGYARLALAAVVFVATFYFVYWVPFSLVPLGDARVLASVGSLLCAVAASWVYVRRSRTPPAGAGATRLGSYVAVGALAVGGLGFVLGFFGPILLTPSSNQGPLLGLFVTGPGGAILGAIGGAVFGLTRRRRVG